MAKMTIKKIQKKDILPSDWNPRSKRDPRKLEKIIKSIQTRGPLGLPIVNPHPTLEGKYIITAGRGRLEAYDDEKEIYVIIKEEDELSAKITSLIENECREQVSDIDNERFIAEIYDEGKKSDRWQSEAEMAALEGLSQEDISKSIIAHNDRETLGLGDHLDLSTNDINESRALLSKPEVRKKLLELRAKGEIKGSGHIVHEIAKLLFCAPDYVNRAFLDDKLDSRNLKNQIINYPVPKNQNNILLSSTINPESTPTINKSKESAKKENSPPEIKTTTETTEMTSAAGPTTKMTDNDRLKIITDLAEYFRQIRTKGIDSIKDPEIIKEAIKHFEYVSQGCRDIIDFYYYFLS